MCVAMYKLLTALLVLELVLPDLKIPKHVRSTQYQFKVFKNVSRCHLDKSAVA